MNQWTTNLLDPGGNGHATGPLEEDGPAFPPGPDVITFTPPHLYITAISVTGPILENGKSRNPPESYRGRIENDDHQIGYDHH